MKSCIFKRSQDPIGKPTDPFKQEMNGSQEMSINKPTGNITPRSEGSQDRYKSPFSPPTAINGLILR